jgi:MoxR-like ATPase
MTEPARNPESGPAEPNAPAPPAAVHRRSGTDEAAEIERVLFEVSRVIVGQDRMIERVLVCLLARGHCLLEGVPGVAKTLAVSTVARAVGGDFARLQFTPDLVPSDVVGTRVYRMGREQFDVELGPVFANFVLADEINRAPAKVQSALLEVMAERQVSLGGHSYPLPEPFLVLATQNPIESEGVYPLPEAQRDRFLMKVAVGYPTAAEELEIVRRMGSHPPHAEQVLSPTDLLRLQDAAADVFVHHAVADYAVRLVLATRDPAAFGVPSMAGALAYGASPRASLGLVAAGRALALIRGRDYVLPDDIAAVAPDVIPHRLVLSYEALADGMPPEAVADEILRATPQPTIAPSSRSRTGEASWQDRGSGNTGQLPA